MFGKRFSKQYDDAFDEFPSFEELFSSFSKVFSHNNDDGSIQVQSDSIKKRYLKNGALHREDGPAVVYLNKSDADEYWLDGRRATKEEIDSLVKKATENQLYRVVINGVPYKLTGKKVEELKEWLKANSSK